MPAAHAVHPVLALPLAYVPAEHGVQPVFAEPVLYTPEPQGTQADALPPGAYEPAPHRRHVVAFTRTRPSAQVHQSASIGAITSVSSLITQPFLWMQPVRAALGSYCD